MAFLKKHFMEQISSIPSNHADSPWSIGVLTVGSFRNPHGSSSQLPRIPVDLQTSPRYERLQHGLSTWFSLRSDCHRLVSSLPNDFICLPCPQWMAMDMDLSPELQLLLPGVQAGSACSPPLSPSSLSLLSFVLPSSVWIRIFLLRAHGVPPVLAWSSVRTAASLDVPDASMERGEPHFHPPLCHLVHPHLCPY